MPNHQKIPRITLSITLLVLFSLSNPLPTKGVQGIKNYYIRLDHHFFSHKSARARVTMVPAENEFRAEIFSLVLIQGTIKADRQTGETAISALAKKQTLARVLQAHGLKSVQSLNQTTIVSYEGVIISPVDITIATYDPSLEGYAYTASVKFSALAFPDQWASLKTQYKIRQIINDFFLLFK